MRLNRVELFYALVAAIDNESRRYLRGRGDHIHAVCMQRWLATAMPPAGRSAMSWLPARGGRLQPRPRYKGAIGCSQAPCKRRPPVGAATQ
ncbi:hypothetical protein GW17_00031989 [Ensete ventricosum]|nr:hypothetical protein GW17_00031989 [Ensete ventricosum]